MVQSLTVFKMKTSIKKFWWGKTTTQRIRLKEYGWVDQTKFYLFGKRGLCSMVANEPVEIETDNTVELERQAMAEILAERPLPHLRNEDFEKFQNEIYPTKF